MRCASMPIELVYRVTCFTEIFFLHYGQRPRSGLMREINGYAGGECPENAHGHA